MRTDRFVLVGILVSFCIHASNLAARQTTSPPQMGYIRVIPDNGATSPDGLAIFGFQNGSNLIGEASMASTSTIQSGRLFVEINATVNTGIAFANPSNEDATINYYFTDTSGQDFGGGVITLPANHQTATYLTDAPFSASPFTGTLTFSSSGGIGAFGWRSRINERSEALMTTVPVSPIGSGFGGTALIIPQFPTGATSATQVVLVNPGETPLSGTVRFFGWGPQNPYTEQVKVVVNGIAGNSFNYTIAPRSVFEMAAQAAPNSGQVGLVRIDPASGGGSPSSLAIFSYQTGGITVSESGTAALPASQAVRLFVESAGVFGAIGSIQTGVSISNPSSSNGVNVQMDLWTLDGTPTGLTSSITIPAGGQILKFANDLFPSLPAAFKGVLEINAPSPFVVEALRDRYNERSDLLMTTIPVYDDTSLPALQTVFPHFVSGTGYWTQLILLSTGGPQSGSLTVLSQDGTELPATIFQPNP
jgi:hypothetical protein